MVTDSRKADPPARNAMNRSSRPAKKANKPECRDCRRPLPGDWVACIEAGSLSRPESRVRISTGPVRADINAEARLVHGAPMRLRSDEHRCLLAGRFAKAPLLEVENQRLRRSL